MFAFRRSILVLTAMSSIVSCRPVTPNAVSPGYNYFPLETGRYIIYDVDEHRYSLSAASVQRTYQLKEIVGAAYADVTGQRAY